MWIPLHGLVMLVLPGFVEAAPEQDGPGSLAKVVLPAVLTIAGTIAGYAFHGWQNRRNLPRIHADSEVLKQLRLERKKLLDDLGRLLFDLDHWIGVRIPGEDKRGRKEWIAASARNIAQVRKLSRWSTGLLLDEKIKLIELVRHETDAASKCLSSYERMEPPDLEEYEDARNNRLNYARALEDKLKF